MANWIEQLEKRDSCRSAARKSSVISKGHPQIRDPNSRISCNLRSFAVESIYKRLGGNHLEAVRIEGEIYAKTAPSTPAYKAAFSSWRPAADEALQGEPHPIAALEPLLLTEEQLRANGYFFWEPEATDILCDRCRQPIASKSYCSFHSGRLCRDTQAKSVTYACCGAPRNSPACSSNTFHVYSRSKWIGTEGPEVVWVLSESSSVVRAFAIDCEMVYTAERGSCVARVSVVSYPSEEAVVDALILPPAPVIDFNTQYSGVSESSFAGGTVLFFGEKIAKPYLEERELQVLMQKYFYSSDIFIGHSLENDLATLGLRHMRVIDTAVLYVEASGAKRALERLTSQISKRFIQNGGTEGHDSVEDAQACIGLVIAHLRQRVTIT